MSRRAEELTPTGLERAIELFRHACWRRMWEGGGNWTTCSRRRSSVFTGPRSRCPCADPRRRPRARHGRRQRRAVDTVPDTRSFRRSKASETHPGDGLSWTPEGATTEDWVIAERLISVNGVELSTQSFGDPADPPILLVMGLGGSMLCWEEGFCRLLAGHGRFAIRYDESSDSPSRRPTRPGVRVSQRRAA